MKEIYVTGSDGLVGSRFVELSSNKFNLLTPEIDELNILDKEALDSFFAKEKPDFVVNFAAHTNLNKAEDQRGDKNASCWQINVEGTKNITEMCRKHGVFLVHISTDNVFSGSKDDQGPYSEGHKIETDSSKLTWYGFTKAEAEREVLKALGNQACILRLIYPTRAKYEKKLDYLRKPLDLFDQGKLYPMFTDQQISVTFIDEVCLAIEKIIEGKKTGPFHASSRNITTPHEIISYLIEKARGEKNTVIKLSLESFLKTVDNPVRYPKYGGLKVEKTEKALGIKYSTWQEIVDQLVEQGLK